MNGGLCYQVSMKWGEEWEGGGIYSGGDGDAKRLCILADKRC